MFKDTPSVSFSHRVIGTWGDFPTPTGRVSYILTKARLGTSGTDNERRLTSLLRPVREVLDPRGLDFNQLLQRDLDDHRVATQLLPYLLKSRAQGPGFFPPIVTVLLPFDGKEPVAAFPNKIDLPDLVTEDEVSYLEQRFGSSFAVRFLATSSKSPHPTIKLGQVLWNEEFARLVVLDGQHRAMALIAIDRTLNSTWDQGPGARFRHFYESRVHALLGENPAIDLNRIEIPVVLCWFPDLHGPDSDAHRAARSLFVDVNKEARQPSEARLTLLSDSELVNIFARSLLNRLRQPSPPLPLFAVEYDNPEPDQATPVRWSVLTNLNFLKFGAQLCVFGPPKYVKDVTIRFGGRLKWPDMNERMRGQLEVDQLFPETIDDGERVLNRSDLGNEHFPLSQVDKLVDAFQTSWGSALLAILGKLEPYAAHCRAISVIEAEWVTDSAMSSLARDAMFDGVGMFWTLRDSRNYWADHVRHLKEQQLPVPPAPEIVKAWKVLEDKNGSFATRRAFEYVGRTDVESVQEVNQLFGILNTHACQLGAVLALATVAQQTDVRGPAVAVMADNMVAAWNAALKANVTKKFDRRFVFARKGIKEPINRIRKLDTPFAVFFRYFWLQLLATPEAQAMASDLVPSDVLNDLVSKARSTYFDYLVAEQVKDLQSSSSDISGKKEDKLRGKAIEIEAKELRRALKTWFGITEEVFDVWLTDWKKSNPHRRKEDPEEVNGDHNGSMAPGGPESEDGESSGLDSGAITEMLKEAPQD